MDMNEENTIIFKNFIEVLKNHISTVSINSWFKDLNIYTITNIKKETINYKKITFVTSSSYIRE